ncbi:MAG: hypothetical protein Kow0079_13190 [Vicingaceae bacterium]
MLKKQVKLLPLFVILFSFLLPCSLKAQQEYIDTTYFIPMAHATFAVQFPDGDLKDRFKTNMNVGGGFSIKTTKNIIFGIKGSFMWNGSIKENDILKDITTVDGYVIDKEGRLTSVFLEERGFTGFLTFGKIFNKFGFNQNSGILTTFGAGFMQHKIRIAFKDEITNLSDEYKKGYDRLSNGPAFNAFVGYIFLSKNRLVNFFGGFEATMAFTKNRRGFNFDTMSEDNDLRNDLLYSIRVGWIIPFNKRTTREYYYY